MKMIISLSAKAKAPRTAKQIMAEIAKLQAELKQIQVADSSTVLDDIKTVMKTLGGLRVIPVQTPERDPETGRMQVFQKRLMEPIQIKGVKAARTTAFRAAYYDVRDRTICVDGNFYSMEKVAGKTKPVKVVSSKLVKSWPLSVDALDSEIKSVLKALVTFASKLASKPIPEESSK